MSSDGLGGGLQQACEMTAAAVSGDAEMISRYGGRIAFMAVGALILVSSLFVVIYFRRRTQRRKVEFKALRCRWSTNVSRPWPLDVSKGSVLSASASVSLEGKELPRDVMRKSINLWDLGTGKMMHSIQTGSNLSAARGSFCKDGNVNVLALGTEIWECDKASGKFQQVASIDIQTTDLKNRITIYKDELGHKRILAVRWFTEWHSVTREYYSRSVTLGLFSGESGKLLENVFTADWSDSKHPKDGGRAGYLDDGKRSRSRSESVGSEDAKSGASTGGSGTTGAAPMLSGATANYRYPDFARLECRLSPNLDYLAVHARDRRRGNRMSMIVWRMRTGKVCINLSPEKHEIAWCNLLVWSADSDMIATSYVEHGGARAATINGGAVTNRLTGFIRIWRVSTKEVRRLPSSIFPPDLRAASLSFTRRGLLAIGGFDGCIRLLDVVNERLISKTQAYIGIVHRIRFSPDGSNLLATGSCGESRFEPRNRGSELKCFALPYAYSFKYTLDGVTRGLSSYLPHDGLCEIIADYVW